MTGVSTNPIFGSHLLVFCMTIGLVILTVTAPRYQKLVGRRRQVLLTLRLLLVALLAIAMLRPSVIMSEQTPPSAVLLLLFDQSQSMQQPAGATDGSRWQSQRNTLSQVERELARFDANVQLRVYGYDRQLHPATIERGIIRFPDQPEGRETDIGSSLQEALDHELGRRIAGVVLIGDGAQTAVNPRVELQQVTRQLARLDSPLYTIAVGPVGDLNQSRDVAVESMPDRFSVFVKNELVVSAALRVRGYVNKDIAVELMIEDSSGASRSLATRRLIATTDNELVPIRLPFVPETPGEYKLTLKAATQAGELVTQNNELTAFLRVLDGGLRVLYLYGDLFGEQQRLRRSIDGSPDIQLDDLFVNLLNRDRWPIDLGAQLQRNSYDVILLESVDVLALSQQDMGEISEMIEKGTGFMMIGGYNSFGAGGYQESPLSDALPIEMGRFERQDLDPRSPISRDLHLWENLKLKPVRSHPVTMLTGEGTWQELPPLLGANKLRPKPSGQVLLETNSGAPILVAGNYGRGRVLAFAGNTTNRWWKYGKQAEHRRFWRQAILWLAHREDLDTNDVWIKLPQRRFWLGSTVEFETGAMSANGEPLSDVEMRAELTAIGSESTPLPLTKNGLQFVGEVPNVSQAGDYAIAVSATRDGEVLGTSQARFQVIDRDIELSEPAADYEQMARLANATSRAGGKPIASEELGPVLAEIWRRYQTAQVEVQSKWQLADTAWDAWLIFLTALGLITAEWVLRKRWGLV